MLFAYSNVWNTCLLILQQQGYRLYLLGNPDDDGGTSRCTWNAQIGDMKFMADNPIELLGLVAIHERHLYPSVDTPYWWRLEGPDLVGELHATWKSAVENS